MMKVIVNGAGGRMGGQVLNILEERGQALQAELAAAVDPAAAEAYPALDVYQGPADVIVDFSFHTSVYALMEYAVSRKLPVVVATTGHSPEELECIRAAAEQIPVFHAANLSLGIALLIRFAKQAAAAFPDADIEIVEVHHNRKVDAPSGTALALAEAVAEVREGSSVVAGRSGFGKRVPGEITVHALRMGNIPGQHEVHITTDTQQLTLRHETHSRALLAEGALSAARFLQGRAPGYYGMEDMIHG